MLIRLGVIIGAIFLFIGIYTLPHYGINWDTINHLPRGQAYLHYFLTGNKTYDDIKDMPGWEQNGKWVWQDPRSLTINTNTYGENIPLRSYYELDATTAEYFFKNDGGGHPPLSDILSAVFNRIFFRELRLVNDIDAYRLYGVFLAACTVGLVFYWTAKKFGLRSGLVSAISLASYPLFWSESHFNTEKDIPQLAYWTFFLFSFWKAINTKKLSWFVVSGLFAGFALGTKFNILFSVFIIIPWFCLYIILNKQPTLTLRSFVKSIKVWAGFLLIPTLMIGILVITWPYLWSDPVTRIQSVISFYKQLGTTQEAVPVFAGPLGTNTYPFLWILFTTPPIVIFLSLFGIMYAIRTMRKDTDKFALLILIAFIIPILRVIWPHSNTYGGVRQLMEYVPALAMLSGVGFYYLEELFKHNKLKLFVMPFVVINFIFLGTVLYKIHPNENVYFNSLIGGLSGAKEKNFPFWGFSFGSPYRQAVIWLNDNAEKDARVVYAYELIPNFPRIWLRSDFRLHNGERSGYLQNGEYALTLNYDKTDDRSYYDSFLVRFVNPVYQVKVDSVPVVSVWKNSQENLKDEFVESLIDTKRIEVSETGLLVDLGVITKLSRIEIDYDSLNCTRLIDGKTEISTDGIVWKRLPGSLPDDWRISKLQEQPKDGHFIEPFLGDPTRYVRFILTPKDTCLKNVKDIQSYSI